MTWHHPIGGEVTGYSPYLLCTGWARWAQEAYGNSDNSIHPKLQRNHQLQAGEIPSVKSPVLSCNMTWAGQLHSPNLVRPPQTLPYPNISRAKDVEETFNKWKHLKLTFGIYPGIGCYKESRILSIWTFPPLPSHYLYFLLYPLANTYSIYTFQHS